jgi:hypothetical protein
MNTDNTISNENNEDNVEVFKMDGVKPLNDPDCNHFFIEEVQEEIAGFTAWTCEHCKRGRYLPKGTKVINN